MSQRIEVLADNHMRKIIQLHSIPVIIVSVRDTRFRVLFKSSKKLGSLLIFCLSYHS